MRIEVIPSNNFGKRETLPGETNGFKTNFDFSQHNFSKYIFIHFIRKFIFYHAHFTYAL
jgi:hypothetical protein